MHAEFFLLIFQLGHSRELCRKLKQQLLDSKLMTSSCVTGTGLQPSSLNHFSQRSRALDFYEVKKPKEFAARLAIIITISSTSVLMILHILQRCVILYNQVSILTPILHSNEAERGYLAYGHLKSSRQRPISNEELPDS